MTVADLDAYDRARPVMFRPGPVVQVSYTGLDQVKPVKDATLFGPKVAEALGKILDVLGREPGDVALIEAPADKGHPGPAHGTLAVLSARQGEGRWPLAFLWVEGADVSLDRAREVLASMPRSRW